MLKIPYYFLTRMLSSYCTFSFVFRMPSKSSGSCGFIVHHQIKRDSVERDNYAAFSETDFVTICETM